MPLVLEGIVTTLNADQSVNLSPMGPLVDRSITRLTFRPYNTSTTYKNLKRTGAGVFHVVDDVELLAKSAVGAMQPPPETSPCETVEGVILCDACRWYAFQVSSLDDSQPRTTIEVDVVDHGRQRDFFGFNRAKHAVVEAAILATRVTLLPREQIQREMEHLSVIVEKTAGSQEQRAFEFLQTNIEQQFSTLHERNEA